jgi:hypothetical protein
MPMHETHSMQVARAVVEGSALAAAREWIARCLEPPEASTLFFGVVLPPMHPPAGRVVFREMTKQWALWHPFNMTKVCEAARAGWDEADLILRELIATFVNRGEQLPAVLAAYNIELLAQATQPRPRGRKKTAQWLQDICIATLIVLLVEQFGLKPRRRQSSMSKPSACSIVAQALSEAGIHRGGERAIEKVWQHYSSAF